MPNRETREYELNEVSWWGKWVDETTWISKNGYVIFSQVFKDERFYNRGGFVGVEKVPEDAIMAMEKEFAKRGRKLPSIMVEEGRRWDKMRACLLSRGYVVSDRMLVMESMTRKSSSKSEPVVDIVRAGSRRNDLQEWTQTYLEAFYGDQKLNAQVNGIMRKVIKDKKVSVLLARIGEAPAGCAVLYRSAGGVAGAYCIGTVPRFRGKGVAATVVKQMREMAESEKRRLILQTLASDRVDGFYVKQGFKLAYVKSMFERCQRKASAGSRTLPSGERFGIRINRDLTPKPTMSFGEVFPGFDKIESVRRLFGPDTEKILSRLKIWMDSPVGYLRVDAETGNIIINPEYLKTGDEKHLYLDVLHELTHVRQFREGKELYDRSYAYFERPTEIEAYRVAVEEARRIGMDKKEIVEYLRVEWVTEDEFLRFVSTMKIDEE